MKNLKKFLLGVSLVALIIIALKLGAPNTFEPKVVEEQPTSLGATAAIPTPIALFQTSLASGITATATSMTLVSARDRDGNSLSGSYAFILEEGTANEEFVNADCTGTACTNMTRGLSVVTGTTSITNLRKPHGRGVSVKITDAPQLLILHRIINGISTFPNKLSYTSHPTFSADTEIIDKKYADDLAIAGSPDASTTVKGISEEATQAEIDAGTATGGTGARLFINPSTLLTSIYKLFLPTTDQKDALAGTSGTPSTSNKYVTDADTSNTIVANKVARYNAGGTGITGIPFVTDIQTFTANGTWTKPTGAKFVLIKAWGSGGGGGGSNSANAGAGGGGGGAYKEWTYDAADLSSTEAVVVGAGGAGGTSGNNGSTGNNSTVGTTKVIAYGGGGGAAQSGAGGGGGGGGNAAIGTSSTTSTGGSGGGLIGGTGGAPGTTSNFGGGGGGNGSNTGSVGGLSVMGGGGGGGGATNSGAPGGGGVGALSFYGGGGGGGSGSSGGAGGTSTYGGAGGAGSTTNGTAGTIPGGGGGAGGGATGVGGAGANGKVVITTYF